MAGVYSARGHFACKPACGDTGGDGLDEQPFAHVREKGVEYSFRYQSDDFWEEWGYTDYAGMKISDLISKVGDTLEYLYDFGDSWRHIIKLEEVINESSSDIPFLICIDGARRCPTEDSGGVSGYHENMDIIKDPMHEEYESTLTWLGDGFDPEYFNLQEVNKVLAGYASRAISGPGASFY